MSSVCILGIGSPSGDEQAGWLTVDALLGEGVQDHGDVVVRKLDRPGAGLLPLLENAPWVILIDAMQGEGEAGRIRRFDQADWADYRQGLSSHGFGVLASLALAQAMASLPARLDLYGIEAGSVTPGDEPGIEVRSAAQRLARAIGAELRVSLGFERLAPRS